MIQWLRRIFESWRVETLRPAAPARQKESIVKKIQVVSAVIGITALSGLAFAHGGMAKMDSNGDGKVTLAEAQAASKRRFERMDKNKNGVVTKDEVPDRAEHYFARTDANKDGQVTLAEAQAAAQAWFQKLDANKDGVLTENEFPHHGGHHGKKDSHAKS
jgi:EF hand domain-containing protein